MQQINTQLEAGIIALLIKQMEKEKCVSLLVVM